MTRDDWRIRIELPDEEGARGLLERLGLARRHAEDLADELREHRLAVSRDGDTVFVYAASGMQAEQASRIVEEELREGGWEPTRLVTERWLRDEERWDDEPAAQRPVGARGPAERVRGNREGPPTRLTPMEDDLLARGYAPWEVRVECKSLAEANDLADRLRADGYGVSHTFRYVIAGTATRDEAVELARRIHGEVEPGGELVYEVAPHNPFAVFGGLGA
jgi:hypothetical protein